MASTAPTDKVWETADKVVREFKETDIKIKDSGLGEDKRYISTFTDASVGKLQNKISPAVGILRFLRYSPHQKRNLCHMEEKDINNVTCTNSIEFKRDKSIKNDGYSPKDVVCSKKLTQNFYNIPRKIQVDACKTDVHRYCEKFSNILPSYDAEGLTLSKELEGALIMRKLLLDMKTIQWISSQYKLADGLTKKEASRIPILEAIQKGKEGDNMRHLYNVVTMPRCRFQPSDTSVHCGNAAMLRVPTEQTLKRREGK